MITPARPVTDHTDRRSNPGPGLYKQTMEFSKKGNNTVFGRSERGEKDKEKALIPGPATYGHEKQAIKLMKKEGNSVFGRDERKPLGGDTKVPGPGTYAKITQIGDGPAVRKVFSIHFHM